jgi:hypothetical protein
MANVLKRPPIRMAVNLLGGRLLASPG